MFLLALDTCLGACSAAIYDLQTGLVVASRWEAMERGHAEVLPVMVEAILREAGVAASDISKIAVTVGPGTFTGLRIGLSFARGFAVAHDIPIVALNSLQATAAPLFDGGDDITVVHHAGATGQIFLQRFSGRGVAISEIVLVPADEVMRDAARLIGTAADGALPDAKAFAHYAATLLTSLPVEPLYMRPADVKPPKLTAQPVADLDFISVDVEAAELLHALHKQSFDHPWTEQSFRELFSVPGTLAVIAQSKLAACGLVVVRQALDEAEILTIGTLPHVRGRGVAKAMLLDIEERLLTNSCDSLFLEVAEDNDAARGLYESVGFTTIGTRKNYYERGAARVDAIMMRKVLE